MINHKYHGKPTFVLFKFELYHSRNERVSLSISDDFIEFNLVTHVFLIFLSPFAK